MSPNDPIVTVRNWRRTRPLRLCVTKKLDIHWCWIKCIRCPHMRAVAIAPYITSGGGRTAGRTCCDKPHAHELRQEGCGATTPVMGWIRHWLGADANQAGWRRCPDRMARVRAGYDSTIRQTVPSVTGSPPPNFQIFREWFHGMKSMGMLGHVA
jgi:hypothetical protein